MTAPRCGSPSCRRAKPNTSCGCECAGDRHGIDRIGGNTPNVETVAKSDSTVEDTEEPAA